MSALEQALDQHLRMADKTYDEWEEYLDIIDPVKYIKLTQGKYAIVDTELFDWLNQFSWYAHQHKDTCYAVRKINIGNHNTMLSMHRQILGLSYGDGKIVDHINRDGLDNRRSNIRIVSYPVNCRNHKLFNTNKSGHTGVSWNKDLNQWETRICVNYFNHNLGYYTDIEDAIIARRLGELKYW